MIDKEKIQALAETLAPMTVGSMVTEITDWLEENTPEPAVIGLTVAQIQHLTNWLRSRSDVNYEALKRWFDVQLFPDWETAPDWANWVAQDENGTWHWYDQKPGPKPNGKWARTEFAQSASYHNIENWKQTLQGRPKPKIEAGQIWQYGNRHYIVTTLGKSKSAEEWVDSVSYKCGELDSTTTTYTRTLSDFLVNFERLK